MVKFFNKIQMQSEDLSALLKDCYFQASGADAAVEDGAFVSIKEVRAHDLYSNMKDMNARNCTAYDSSYAKNMIGFVDFVGVSEGSINGVTYKIGDKIVGTAPAAGENTRVRMIGIGDEFYVGDGNFTTAPTVGTDLYAVPATGTTTLTGATAAPTTAGTPYFAIEDERPLIMGTVNEGSKLYRLRFLGWA